jgi:hypothetical protein
VSFFLKEAHLAHSTGPPWGKKSQNRSMKLIVKEKEAFAVLRICTHDATNVMKSTIREQTELMN